MMNNLSQFDATPRATDPSGAFFAISMAAHVDAPPEIPATDTQRSKLTYKQTHYDLNSS